MKKEYVEAIIEIYKIDKSDIICSSDTDLPDDDDPVENDWRPPGTLDD